MATLNSKLEFNLENGDILIIHPETNSGQVYDFANGQWLDRTIEEILNLLTEHAKGLVTDQERVLWGSLRSGNAVSSAYGVQEMHPPSRYYAMGMRTTWENWKDTIIGIPNASDISWCAMLTIIPYYTAEEDKLTQVAYTEYGVFVRNSVGDVTETAVWGAWDKLATESKLNAHINNSAIHMSQSEKDNINSHINNSTIHITMQEKSNINSHIADGAIHVTQAEKTSMSSHIANNSIHVTQAQKDSFTSHVADNSIHITQAQKDSLISHMNNSDYHLTAFDKENIFNHLEDTVSHLSQQDKSNLIGHLTNNTVHITSTERSNWNAKVGTTNYATTTTGGVVKIDNSTITINSSGVISANVSIPTFRYVHVFSSVAQAVPSGTATELTFSSVQANIGGFTTTSPRIYIPSGISYVRVVADITMADYFKSITVYVRKNNTSTVRLGGHLLTYTGSTIVASGMANIVSHPIPVVQGDFISIVATHYLGSNSNFTLNNLSVEAIG